MTTIDVNSVLSQIRSINARTQQGASWAPQANEGIGKSVDFSSVMKAQGADAPRSNAVDFGSPAVAPASTPSISGIQQGGFGSLVRQGVDAVNARQAEAGALQQRFELGDSSVDLASVMVAGSKAQVSFRAMVEVRNRLVSAYQEVMNMPV